MSSRVRPAHYGLCSLSWVFFSHFLNSLLKIVKFSISGDILHLLMSSFSVWKSDRGPRCRQRRVNRVPVRTELLGDRVPSGCVAHGTVTQAGSTGRCSSESASGSLSSQTGVRGCREDVLYLSAQEQHKVRMPAFIHADGSSISLYSGSVLTDGLLKSTCAISSLNHPCIVSLAHL